MRKQAALRLTRMEFPDCTLSQSLHKSSERYCPLWSAGQVETQQQVTTFRQKGSAHEISLWSPKGPARAGSIGMKRVGWMPQEGLL